MYAIYSIGESGDVVVEQTLINRSSSFVTYPLQGMGVVGFAATGAKTYVFGKITVAGATYQIPTTASLKAFDITSPASVQEVATLALPSAESTISVDGAGKRMYIQTPVTGYGNKPAPVDVYDISSSPLSFKAVGSYSDACVMSGLSEQSDVIKEIKKLYNIPESQAVIATGGCSSNGSKLKMDGNKGMVTIPGSYLSLPGATVFNAAENQNYNAFNTQYSSYGAPWYMVFVDLSDLAKPKILGIASARQISVRSTGGMVGAPEEGDIIYSFNYNGNLSPVVVHRNRYVYRTLHRTADVFEFTNIQATTPPPPPTTPPPTGGGPIVKPPTFIFQNLLNMFKRILLFKIGG